MFTDYHVFKRKSLCCSCGEKIWEIYTLDPLKGKEKVDYSYIKKNFLDVLVCVRPTEKNYKREKRESFLIPINKSKLFLASILTLVTQGIILTPPLIIKKNSQ